MELRGRRDDMLIVRGVNVFPSQVEHVLLSVDGVAPHYRLIVERTGAMDELTLECEPAPGAEADDLAARDRQSAARAHGHPLRDRRVRARHDPPQ